MLALLRSARGSLSCPPTRFIHLCLSLDMKSLLHSPWWVHCLLTLPLGSVPGCLLYPHAHTGLILIFSNCPDAILLSVIRQAVQLTFLPYIQNRINHLRWPEKVHFSGGKKLFPLTHGQSEGRSKITTYRERYKILHRSCWYFHCHSMRWIYLIICFVSPSVFCPQFSPSTVF